MQVYKKRKDAALLCSVKFGCKSVQKVRNDTSEKKMETKYSKSYIQTKHKKCNMYNNIQNIAVTFVVTIFVLRGNKEPNCSIVNLLRFESYFFVIFI